jgi:hypothetical protein
MSYLGDKTALLFVLDIEHKQQVIAVMESSYISNTLPVGVHANPSARSSRRKGNGPATAALLIQMATEMLTTSPTMRQRMNITLTDLAAADKIRKSLLKESAAH